MSLISDALRSGGTFLKWETPGTSYTGTITAVELRQARKFESTELSFWDDGSPQMQVVLTLATDYRDPGNPDDDGNRQLSINLWSGQKKALVSACKAAGVAEPEVGQTFTATHTEGIGNAKSPRVFAYAITPAPSALSTIITHDVPSTFVPPAAAAPAVTNPVEIAKLVLAAGVSNAEAAKASGLPETVVAALANAA